MGEEQCPNGDVKTWCSGFAVVQKRDDKGLSKGADYVDGKGGVN
jgi:hypothetical protein